GRGQVVELDPEWGRGVDAGVGQGGRGSQSPALAYTPGAGGGVGRVVDMAQLQVGDLHGRGQEVVVQRGGEELAVVIVDVVLVEGAADALGDGPFDLALDDLGVVHPPGVLHADEAEDLDGAGAGVDLHHGGLGPGGEGAPHGVVAAGRLQARFGVGRQTVRLEVGDPGHLGH